MKLLAAALYDPTTAVSKSTASAIAMTAIDTTNLRLSFTIPASGKVRVRLGAVIHGATTFPSILLGVMSGATVKGRVAPIQSLGNTAVATALVSVEADFIVTGQTPGAATWDAAYAVETGIASTGLKYGGPDNTTANDAFGAFFFEIWDVSPNAADDVWNAARASYVTAGTFGQLGLGIIFDGTATAGSASSITLPAAAPNTVDIFKGTVIVIYGGTGAGQVRTISAYSNTRVATVVPNFVVTPDATSKVMVLGFDDPALVGSDAKVLLSADAQTGVTIPTVTTLTGHTPQTGDAYARLGSPTGASISADIAANKTVVDAIKVRTDLSPEGFKKNTARANFTFVMTDSTTHQAKSGLTNASFTKKYRLDAGSVNTLSGTITEVDATNFPGLYSIDLTAGELNGDMVVLRFAASGADDLELTIKTSP